MIASPFPETFKPQFYKDQRRRFSFYRCILDIILSRLNWPNFFGSNDFVFFQRDDPKDVDVDVDVDVGDGVCEFMPLFGQRLTKEPQNCFCELAECSIVTIAGDPFMHDAPETFYRIKMRCIWC